MSPGKIWFFALCVGMVLNINLQSGINTIDRYVLHCICIHIIDTGPPFLLKPQRSVAQLV